jgi:citrate synthase
MSLKETLRRKIEEFRPRTQRLLREFGKVKIDDVTIEQCIGGGRDIPSLVTDISYLDPYDGIRFRGKSINETFEALPKPPGALYPTVEAFWYFLLTGDVPTEDEVEEVLHEFRARANVPYYVYDIIRALPVGTHPMVMLSSAVLSMQRDSKFARFYNSGRFNKRDAWAYMYEDASDLVARLPEIAAFIYRYRYRNCDIITSDPELDLGANFAHMMGIDPPYDDLSRMYFIIHSDHESGNVSAHTTHLVASALSDAFYAYSAGLNGLAGPLHGLANQEALRWIMAFEKKLNGATPTRENVTSALWDTLNAGQIIPGYGHAVLRRTDPRFLAQRDFCMRIPALREDPLVKLVSMLFETAPAVLAEHGKIRNPWPNVDAHSGVIQSHYGVREWDFYTVLFGVGRSIGCMANITWDRALGYAIERPKSVTTTLLEKWAMNGGRKKQ